MWTIGLILIVVCSVASVVVGGLLALVEWLCKRASQEQEAGLWGDSWLPR